VGCPTEIVVVDVELLDTFISPIWEGGGLETVYTKSRVSTWPIK
jgi:hypothetical protein